MDYLLKASGIVVILFLFYIVFLKDETFFKSIRSYFLIGLIVVVSIPLIEIPVYIETVSNSLSMIDYKEIATSNANIINSFNWIQFLTLLYLVGVSFFSIKFLVQLTSLLWLVTKHSAHKKNGYYFIETVEDISPFSFFNIIIYNKSQFTSSELEQIINHEKAHVLQWHSLDTIFAHLLVITLWFNPFVWLYKKAVQQNLEFLADSYAIQLAENKKLYQITLLKTCGANYCTEITNNFYNSLIKKRIIMIHKNKSTNKKQWKYILLIPIFIAFVMTFNTKVVAQEKQLIEVEEMMIDLIIDKNSSDADLESESATFKTEANVDLSFKKIKRNSINEITAIKIQAKGETVNAKFENSGTEPINPIRISFDSSNNSVSIGNVEKIHTEHFTYKIHADEKANKGSNYVFISSDGKKSSWTSKSSDTIIDENIIVIKNENDKEHTWISEDGKNEEIKVKVIEVKDGKKIIKITETSGQEEEIEIIEEGNEHSENIFIIKNEDGTAEKMIVKKLDGKTIQEKTENRVYFKTDSNDEPLFLLDGKEISKQEMDKINPDSIESINVLKGESAIKKYGEKAEHGVVEIFVKKNK